MLRIKALGTLSFAALGALGSFGSLGSTCHGSSNGANGANESGTATGDPPADVNLPGVDTSMLTTRERREYAGYVTELLAPCSDTPVPVAQCITEKRACARCLPAAKFVLKGVRDGASRDQIEKAYHARFDADKVKNVPIDGSSYKGPDSAPVTLVEFADFTCPHCRLESPKLEDLWESHKTQIRFVYKFFPLSGPGHEFGETAARVAAAAALQNKFWEMHDAMFEHQDGLDANQVDALAKQFGLDVNKLHTDMESQAIKDKVANDKKLGEALGVGGTPTIFINGREFGGDLNEWINMELAGTQSASATTTTSSASAAVISGDAGQTSIKTDASTK